MAPAIVHFLVGASVVLLVAAPFALRYDLDRYWGVWLTPLGGIWGLVPDVHHISPVFRDALYGMHGSPVVDLFAFHYTLDTPVVRGLANESTFAAIVFFLLAVATLSLLSILGTQLRTRRPHTRSQQGGVVVLATLLGAGYAATAWGLVVRITGGFANLAALVGAESILIGWSVLVVCSLVGAVGFAVVFETVVPPAYASRPLLGGLVGIPLGIATWVLGVVVAGPLWLHLVVGRPVALLSVDWQTLLGLLVFGVAFGTVFATVRGTVETAP